MNDTERAEGARLLAAMTPPNWVVYPDNHSADGWLIFGPDGDGLVTCHGNCGMQATDDGGDERADAAGIAWLVNHAAELLADSAERGRYLDTLAWYAATDDADRAADQGRRARDTLRAAGRGDAIAAAEAAIGKERDAG